MSAKYDNTDRWRHLKHFIDTHPYSEDNLKYLKTWITHFTVPPKQSEEYTEEDYKSSPKMKQLMDEGKFVDITNLSLPRTKKLHYD